VCTVTGQVVRVTQESTVNEIFEFCFLFLFLSTEQFLHYLLQQSIPVSINTTLFIEFANVKESVTPVLRVSGLQPLYRYSVIKFTQSIHSGEFGLQKLD
jgi:hypothetical protein